MAYLSYISWISFSLYKNIYPFYYGKYSRLLYLQMVRQE